MNECQQLPLDFSVERLAHFVFVPSSGLVLPGMSLQVQVCFVPKQLGVLNRSVDLTLAGETVHVPLKVTHHQLRPAYPQLCASCQGDNSLQTRTRAHALAGAGAGAGEKFVLYTIGGLNCVSEIAVPV